MINIGNIMRQTEKKRVVIIGGGFAGLNMVQKLDNSIFDITLVDRNNYHSFPPLFYQVASGGLEPGSISFPFRRELRKRKIRGARFYMADVLDIDYNLKRVITDDGSLDYDILVIAAGTTNNFFGNQELSKKVFTLKSTVEAIRCRDELLSRLERASNADSPEERRRLLSFVVIGGGPTGVEVAGAIGEMKRYIIDREYPQISQDEMSITIIEGTDRLLHTMDSESSVRAKEYLEQLMVDVKLGRLVKSYDGNTVVLDNGTELSAETVIWTAGVTGESLGGDKENGTARPERGPGNRIIVDGFNRVPGFDNVYAIGDICLNVDKDHPRGYPQLAQVAIQQAQQLASRLNHNKWDKEFRYNDMGSMATVGRNRAVVELHKWKFGGWFAWITWMFVHLISLMGMRNRLNVLINWTWAYFTYNSALRVFFKMPKNHKSK